MPRDVDQLPTRRHRSGFAEDAVEAGSSISHIIVDDRASAREIHAARRARLGEPSEHGAAGGLSERAENGVEACSWS
jgi:hypothetical protein